MNKKVYSVFIIGVLGITKFVGVFDSEAKAYEYTQNNKNAIYVECELNKEFK